jgi:hypothetical protein
MTGHLARKRRSLLTLPAQEGSIVRYPQRRFLDMQKRQRDWRYRKTARARFAKNNELSSWMAGHTSATDVCVRSRALFFPGQDL